MAVRVAGRREVLDVDAVGPVEVGIVVAFQPADDIGRDKGEHAALRRFGDEMAEPGEGRKPHAAELYDKVD